MANDYNFTIDCSCCATTLFSVTGADRQAWKDDANDQGGHKAECPTCGCLYVTEDDGTVVSSGGGVQRKDVSQPRIDSLGATQDGPTAGGTVVRLNGHSYDVLAPTVKFDGVAGTSLNVLTDETLDVTTPAGKVKLNIVGMGMKLTHGSVTGGPFVVGETVTGGTSAATGTVLKVDAAFLVVEITGGVFENGEVLTGGTSAATATTDADPTMPVIAAAETLTGQTSAVTATCQEASPVRVDTLSGSFTADEWVEGGTSGAWAKLDATTPMDGFVTVTVENSNGQRSEHRITHGTVTGTFQEGETITGGTSGTTATIRKIKSGYLIIVDETGVFTAAETITGGTSGATAAVTAHEGGHLVGAFEYTA